MAAGLDAGVAYLKTLSGLARDGALAAHLMPEGHWRLANAKGEIVTVSGPDEWKRALVTLLPEVGETTKKTGKAIAVYLTDETAAGANPALADIPIGMQLYVVAGGQAWTLVRAGAGSAARLLAEIRPQVVVGMPSLPSFREAIWQLNRRLDQLPGRGALRLIALEPGGSRILPTIPRLQPGTRLTITDAVDPYGLPKALAPLTGQTIAVVGRREGELLWFRTKAGAEQSLLLSDLSRAAAQADLNLIVIEVAQARQPGARTWLYSRVTVAGLDAAMRAATVADFYQGLAQSLGGVIVRARELGSGRTALEARPLSEAALGSPATPAQASEPAAKAERGVGAILQDAVIEVTGKLAAQRIEMDAVSRSRSIELGRRLIPGIPSQLQSVYLVLFLAGLLGLPVAAGWWRRVWPLELRAEYGSMFGYWAAKSVRGVLFLLIFMPIVAIASMPVRIIRSCRRGAGNRATIHAPPKAPA